MDFVASQRAEREKGLRWVEDAHVEMCSYTFVALSLL